ncbi:hypothetical protein Tco_0271112 [Tanacetum coccineum]
MDLLRLIKQDSLSLEEKIIILLRRSRNVVSLIIEWMKGVKIRGGRWGIGTRSTIILIIISLSEWTHDSINDIVNAIVKMRIMFHDVSIETSQEHANLIRSECDILAFDGAAQLDTVQLKKSTNIVGTRKIGMIWLSKNDVEDEKKILDTFN